MFTVKLFIVYNRLSFCNTFETMLYNNFGVLSYCYCMFIDCTLDTYKITHTHLIKSVEWNMNAQYMYMRKTVE